jgi:hypothetical protein
MKASPPEGGPSWFFFAIFIGKYFTSIDPKERAAAPGQEISRGSKSNYSPTVNFLNLVSQRFEANVKVKALKFLTRRRT